MRASQWFLRRHEHARQRRLYCFPYAGGNAAVFLPWQAALPVDVTACAVLLPGRGARLAEPAATHLDTLAYTIAEDIARQDHGPFALFGHSLGALLAFEVARHSARMGAPAPQRLFVSGCAAPRHPTPSRNLHRLPDQALLNEVAAFNGTAPELLANKELMQLALPGLRADFALVESYRYNASPPLTMPITVLAGRQDPHCAHADPGY